VWYLEQGGGVGDVVAHPPLRGDADLILLDGRILPRLLHPLVPVHPSSASLSLHALLNTMRGEPAQIQDARAGERRLGERERGGEKYNGVGPRPARLPVVKWGRAVPGGYLVGVREPAVASSARWRRCGGGGR
jgi:hypothetical protein